MREDGDEPEPALGAGLTTVSGAMFSGKTRYTILEIRAHNRAGGSAPIVFRPDTDTRDGNLFRSHDEEPLVLDDDEAHIQIVGTGELRGIGTDGRLHEVYDFFVFDEAQFFDAFELIATALHLRAAGKRVLVAGLERSFKHRLWPWMRLVSFTRDHVPLAGTCDVCHEIDVATHSLLRTHREHTRQIEDTATSSARSSEEAGTRGRPIIIGGANEYRVVCDACLPRHERILYDLALHDDAYELLQQRRLIFAESFPARKRSRRHHHRHRNRFWLSPVDAQKLDRVMASKETPSENGSTSWFRRCRGYTRNITILGIKVLLVFFAILFFITFFWPLPGRRRAALV